MRNLLSNSESIDVCEDSTYRIYNYYVTGQEFEFEAYINAGYSQPLINKAIGKGSSYENNSAYFNRLAPYFIFVVCAVISILINLGKERNFCSKSILSLFINKLFII